MTLTTLGAIVFPLLVTSNLSPYPAFLNHSAALVFPFSDSITIFITIALKGLPIGATWSIKAWSFSLSLVGKIDQSKSSLSNSLMMVARFLLPLRRPFCLRGSSAPVNGCRFCSLAIMRSLKTHSKPVYQLTVFAVNNQLRFCAYHSPPLSHHVPTF